MLPILAANKFDLPIFLPQVGYRILEKHGVQTHVRTQKGHITKHSSKCIKTGLALDEVIRIIPWRPGMTEKKVSSAGNQCTF
jgi:hypothetical protein